MENNDFKTYIKQQKDKARSLIVLMDKNSWHESLVPEVLAFKDELYGQLKLCNKILWDLEHENGR